MNYFIRKDLYRYTRATSFSSAFRCFFLNPAFRFMLIFRLCRGTSPLNPLGVVLRIYYRILRVRYGYQIPFGTNIGGGFLIGHFGNIVINHKAVIGEDCNITQGVTIGIANRGDRKGCPTIGNRVWIGPNSVVVGNVKIGNDVLIAPLSYVVEDVPDNAVVMGNPAKIVSYKGSEGYVNNVLEESVRLSEKKP